MCHPDVTVQLFAKFSRSNNMWFSEIYADRVMHFAFNSTGHTIDEFTQYVEGYKI